METGDIYSRWKKALTDKMVKDSNEYAPVSNMAAVEPLPISGAMLAGHVYALSMLAAGNVLEEEVTKKKEAPKPSR